MNDAAEHMLLAWILNFRNGACCEICRRVPEQRKRTATKVRDAKRAASTVGAQRNNLSRAFLVGRESLSERADKEGKSFTRSDH